MLEFLMTTAMGSALLWLIYIAAAIAFFWLFEKALLMLIAWLG